MADNRTISQLEAEGYPWIGCECCKGTVWVPFKMLRQRIPMLSAMTLDQLGAKMRCDKCGKRPERYYPANQNDTPGSFEAFRCPGHGQGRCGIHPGATQVETANRRPTQSFVDVLAAAALAYPARTESASNGAFPWGLW